MKLQIILSPEAAPAARVGYEFDFAGEAVVLGRGPESPIQLEGTQLSREHLAFQAAGDALTLTDLSSNGVWLNGQPLPKKTPILCGPFDEVRIAGYTMTARLLTPPAPELPVRVSKPIEIPEPSAPPPFVAPAPAWWRFDGVERWTVILVAFAIAFVLLYRMA